MDKLIRVRKLAIPAGVIAAVCVGALAAGSVQADSRHEDAHRLDDEGGSTPVARSGSPLAARRALAQGQLRARLESELRRVGGQSGAWVYDIRGRGPRLLYSDHGRDARVLASNTKLFTTAAYLEALGPEGRLRTRIWARGTREGPDERVLKGSLALVGAGDPALASPSFAANHHLPLTRLKPLARAVRRAGIRRVEGVIRADDTVFDRRRGVPQTGVGFEPTLGPLSGLSYDSGMDAGHFASDPARVAGEALERTLRKLGVRVTQGVEVGGTGPSLQERAPLAALRSPTAARLLAETNKESNNFFAETMLKRLAASGAHRGTTARGARKVERLADRWGSGVRLENGSGLSRRDRASPRQVGQLLVHLAGDGKLAKPFRASLAIAGRDGTLENRMRGTAAEGRCQAKTGTINFVSALSGYCKSRSGLVAFSLLMNSVDVGAAQRAQDAMASAIARYGR